MARRGLAVEARVVIERLGTTRQSTSGMETRGAAAIGLEWQARRRMARSILVGIGVIWQARRGSATHGLAWHGPDWFGESWQARLGLDGRGIA